MNGAAAWTLGLSTPRSDVQDNTSAVCHSHRSAYASPRDAISVSASSSSPLGSASSSARESQEILSARSSAAEWMSGGSSFGSPGGSPRGAQHVAGGQRRRVPIYAAPGFGSPRGPPPESSFPGTTTVEWQSLLPQGDPRAGWFTPSPSASPRSGAALGAAGDWPSPRRSQSIGLQVLRRPSWAIPASTQSSAIPHEWDGTGQKSWIVPAAVDALGAGKPAPNGVAVPQPKSAGSSVSSNPWGQCSVSSRGSTVSSHLNVPATPDAALRSPRSNSWVLPMASPAGSDEAAPKVTTKGPVAVVRRRVLCRIRGGAEAGRGGLGPRQRKGG